MEVAFLISLRFRIHSLKLNLNGRITGSTRICLVLLMLLSLESKQWGYAVANRQGHVLSYPVTMTTLYVIVSTHLDRSSSPITPVTISCFRPDASNVRLVSNIDGSPETLSIIIGK
nr:MAG TPA: hypothetical protein [Caudoviricetes sp.]